MVGREHNNKKLKLVDYKKCPKRCSSISLTVSSSRNGSGKRVKWKTEHHFVHSNGRQQVLLAFRKAGLKKGPCKEASGRSSGPRFADELQVAARRVATDGDQVLWGRWSAGVRVGRWRRACRTRACLDAYHSKDDHQNEKGDKSGHFILRLKIKRKKALTYVLKLLSCITKGFC